MKIRDRVIELRRVKARDLRANPKNWRQHPKTQADAMRGVLSEIGFAGASLARLEADGSLVLLDGHLRRDIADDAEIPVLVTDLTPAEGDYLLATYDPLSALAGRDNDALRELLAGVATQDAAVRALLDSLQDTQPKAGNTDPDDVPPAPVEPVTHPGDLWLLGEHRLLCGDSTKAEDVGRLMGGSRAAMVATDPPYAIYGSSTGIGTDIADDKMVRPFFESILRTALENIEMFAHVYVCCDWRSWPSWWEMGKRVELSPKNLIVWDKGGAGLGSSYANAYELVGFFARLPKQTVMTSNQKAGQRQVHKSNIWRGNKVQGGVREHNAQKPVELMEFLIENSSDVGAIVLDPFLGSGTTLIACERLGRRCYAMEIAEKYCDVAVVRWQQFSGREASLESTGELFDRVAERVKSEGRTNGKRPQSPAPSSAARSKGKS